jgi:hypothetical protein
MGVRSGSVGICGGDRGQLLPITSRLLGFVERLMTFSHYPQDISI